MPTGMRVDSRSGRRYEVGRRDGGHDGKRSGGRRCKRSGGRRKNRSGGRRGNRSGGRSGGLGSRRSAGRNDGRDDGRSGGRSGGSSGGRSDGRHGCRGHLGAQLVQAPGESRAILEKDGAIRFADHRLEGELLERQLRARVKRGRGLELAQELIDGGLAPHAKRLAIHHLLHANALGATGPTLAAVASATRRHGGGGHKASLATASSRIRQVSCARRSGAVGASISRQRGECGAAPLRRAKEREKACMQVVCLREYLGHSRLEALRRADRR
mmetsp:Transcript_3994/g.10379  ORF Transcript_3994/g.10379 Transcript_3994/m.10379 type:complete len:271 (+) Transcript_3994:225-1037(+)